MSRLAALGDLETGEGEELFLRRSSAPRIAAQGRDFLDGVVDQDLSLASARDLVLAEFERRYVRHLDAQHVDERARVSASGVSDRYLRTLRLRAKMGV